MAELWPKRLLKYYIQRSDELWLATLIPADKSHIHKTVLKKVTVDSIQHDSIYVKTQKHVHLKKSVK